VLAEGLMMPLGGRGCQVNKAQAVSIYWHGVCFMTRLSR
jgi:hypothetical protein